MFWLSGGIYFRYYLSDKLPEKQADKANRKKLRFTQLFCFQR